MNKFIISIALGASALFATAASAAPLSHGVAVIPDNGIENVRMICNEDGRCWRERGQRRVIIDNSYNYAPRERYIDRRGYSDRGYYNDGPASESVLARAASELALVRAGKPATARNPKEGRGDAAAFFLHAYRPVVCNAHGPGCWDQIQRRT